MRNILIYFAYKYHGEYEKILNAVKNKEGIDSFELEKIKQNPPQAITILDDNYPEEFKSSFAPPLVIFYKGDLSLLENNQKLAVIGSRTPTLYGVEATKKILNELFKEKDTIIVSGMARGIDAVAHLLALENNKKTIAILGCGIDYCYPHDNVDLKKRIEEKGLLLSEYPLDTKPKKEYFPLRNRLIASLVKGVLVTDAKNKSGTQITVRLALEQGKDIFTIPHSIFDESFCNELLRQGAIPIIKGEDLLEFF